MVDQFIKKKYYFMKQALEQAKKALTNDEVPVGAIVVDPRGNIVSQSYNRVNKAGCQTEHAEMRAIRAACKKLGDWRLDGYWVYVTLEPCTMCIGLMRLCRISGLVYGADSPLFGYHLDKDANLQVYKKNTIDGEDFQVHENHIFRVIGGVCSDESASMLKHFFKQKRKEGEL